MKIEITIRNGSGWNNYPALRELTAFPPGTRGLLRTNGIQTLLVEPRDGVRPFGIAARYYNTDGDLIFTQNFDYDATADYIRERVGELLRSGIENRIRANANEIYRANFIKKISAWRRNFDQPGARPDLAAERLRAKLGKLRQKHGNRVSRSTCWELTHAVRTGKMTFRDAVAKITACEPPPSLNRSFPSS